LLALVAVLAVAGCSDGGRPEAQQPPFQGIDLSAVQRTRIRLVQERYADRFREVQGRLLPKLRASSSAWNRGDSVEGAAAWARSAAERAELRAIGDSMQAEIREILTAEQRPLFDRNAAAVREQSEDLDRRQGQSRMLVDSLR
jgi:Spy/CpxP family protein refolding chaperone